METVHATQDGTQGQSTTRAASKLSAEGRVVTDVGQVSTAEAGTSTQDSVTISATPEQEEEDSD